MRAAAACLCLLWLPACGGGTGGRGPAAPPPAPREVTVAPTAELKLPRTLDVNGVLAAQDELALALQVGGRLQTVGVDVGDQVQQGQLLAALDERDFQLALQRAEAALAAARARLGLQADADPTGIGLETTPSVREARAVLAEAELQRERSRQMVKENLRAQAELDAAEAACEVAASRVQGARDSVRTWIAEAQQRKVEFEQAKKNLADARLLAPWPGRVQARQAVAGQYVQAGTQVLALVRIDPLRLRLPVPERLAGGIALGQTVRFLVDGGDGKEREGTVRRLSPGIERGTRTLQVEAEVANGDGSLRPGAFCRAHIVLAEAEAVLAVPQSALLSFAGIDRVFEVDGGKAKERLVVPGRRSGDLVEIVSGLPAGTAVVQQARGLVSGAAVVVKG